MKKLMVFTAMFLGVLVAGFSQSDYAVHNTSSWIEAINGIRNGGNNQTYTITVTGNISVPASQESTFGPVTGITVTITGGGSLSTSNKGTLLVIGSEQTIIAIELTLKGQNANNAPLVIIASNGTFRMEGKSSVSGNKNSGSSGGGGVYSKGTFTMQDSASVSGNSASKGGGVYVGGGTFTLQGSASVSGNIASGGGWTNSGGGVYVEAGTFTMQGGTISGNTTVDGAGVYVGSGTFTLLDGIITNNSASNGGGGVGFEVGIFNMQGGSISDNKSESCGGGVYGASGMGGRTGNFFMTDGTISGNIAPDGAGVYNKGAFTMENGSISKNISSGKGGGVYAAGGSFTMQGGSISGNIASTYGGGVFVNEDNPYNRVRFSKTGGTFFGFDSEPNLKNTVVSRLGHAVYKAGEKNWRNVTAGPTMNNDSYGFWLNDGDDKGDTVVTFPEKFAETRQRPNFKNILTVTENTMKSNSSNTLWILQSVSGDSYTLKRSDAANTMTLVIKLGNFSGGRAFGGGSYSLVISGDSGSGENNWNGTWY